MLVALLLAAGAGTRFTGPGHKLAAELHGRPVLEHAIASARAAAIGPVVVVTRPDEAPERRDVVTVVNDDWADGQATSLRRGLDAAAAMGADAVVVGLGDQPFIRPEAWREVAAHPSPIVVATYDGHRGHPVKLARAVWDLVPATGDQGARRLLQDRPDLVAELPCEGSPTDIDTVEDLERWQSSSSTSSPSIGPSTRPGR